MLAIDTETTGVDFFHGAKPFFVTITDEEGETYFWEWEVDPLTREPRIPDADKEEIDGLIFSPTKGNELILHNAKFDVHALKTIGIPAEDEWPWEQTYDTLRAAHILGSNLPKDLTSLATRYLNTDIEPLEKKLRKEVLHYRRQVKSKKLDWAIAKSGRFDMPSAKEETWKYDTWLPKAFNRNNTTLRDYANADSVITVSLWKVFKEEMKRKGLWQIFLTTNRVYPIVYNMERRGVTANSKNLASLESVFEEEVKASERICVNLAKERNYELSLPKGKSNKSLEGFVEGLVADLVVQNNREGKKTTVAVTPTGKISLKKEYVEALKDQFPPRSKQATFFTHLQNRTKRLTALNYMAGYKRFWLPIKGRSKLFRTLADDWYVLHPSLNPTGSDTLRFSCKSPNEQNISKQEGFNLRYCFGPAPGREWWSLDAKNIELRLPFYESDEKELIALFERESDPPYYGSTHLLNFHTVYPDIWEKELAEVGIEKVGPHCKKKYAASWYQYCKNGGFAKQYGAGKNKVDGTFKRAGAYDLIASRFSRLENLNQKWIKFANRNGYVETIPDRIVNPERGYPLRCTRTDNGGILTTVPLNYHVQGSAMWWTIKAMLRIQEKLDYWYERDGFDGFITMQVHDEVVLDFPSGANPKEDEKNSNLGRIREIVREMEKGGEDYGIPTPVGIEYHSANWSEGITF